MSSVPSRWEGSSFIDFIKLAHRFSPRVTNPTSNISGISFQKELSSITPTFTKPEQIVNVIIDCLRRISSFFVLGYIEHVFVVNLNTALPFVFLEVPEISYTVLVRELWTKSISTRQPNIGRQWCWRKAVQVDVLEVSVVSGFDTRTFLYQITARDTGFKTPIVSYFFPIAISNFFRWSCSNKPRCFRINISGERTGVQKVTLSQSNIYLKLFINVPFILNISCWFMWIQSATIV